MQFLNLLSPDMFSHVAVAAKAWSDTPDDQKQTVMKLVSQVTELWFIG
jgi:hypothetical protein